MRGSMTEKRIRELIAADIDKSETSSPVQAVAVFSGPLAPLETPDVIYEAQAGDVLSLWGNYSGAALSIGVLEVYQASIHAQRVG